MGWPLWNPAIGWWLLIDAGVALNFIMGLIAAVVAHWVVIIGLIAAGVALVVIIRVAMRFRAAWPRERPDNGIRVGAPRCTTTVRLP